MKKIVLKSLKLKGFRSFKDESVIVFPESGPTLIMGKDLRTGGSNGSGKSSVLEAIYWALGISTLPATELKNYESKSIEVLLVLDINGEKWTINKSSKSLEISVNGVLLDGLKSSMQDRLHAAIGDMSIFEALSYRRQADLGNFFYNQDSKLKSFFIKCLPELERLEQISESATKKSNTLKSDFELKSQIIKAEEDRIKSQEFELFPVGSDVNIESAYNNDIKDLKSSLDKVISNIEFNKGLYKDVKDKINTPNISDEIKQTIDRLESQLDLIKKKKNEEIESLNSILTSHDKKILDIKSQASVLSSSLRDLKNEASSINAGISKLPIFEKNLKDLFSQKAHLEEGKCPTCMQLFPNTEGALLDISNKIQSVKEDIKKIFLNKGRLSQIEESISKITSDISFLEVEASKATDEKSEVRIKISQIGSQINEAAGAIDSKIKEIINSSTQKEVGDLNKSLMGYSDIISKLMSEKTEILGKILLLEEKLNNFKRLRDKNNRDKELLSAKKEELSTIEKLYKMEVAISEVSGKKGVLGMYFEGLIKEIQEEANKIIFEIPNTSDLSLEISSFKETKSGDQKMSISPKILKWSNEISFRSLSGGQQAALSLCVDLAMNKALNRRVGIKPGWIALDEAMDGMDNESKSSAMSLINRFLNGYLVLVIDHSTEIKEAFNNTIEIEYNGSTSKVV